MATATWELIFRRRDQDRTMFQAIIRSTLDRLQQSLTVMRLDYLAEEDQFSVMVGDVNALRLVLYDLRDWGPQRIQVSIVDDESLDDHLVKVEAALTEDEDEASISISTGML